MAYKVFTNGSVLQASEINDNLMNQSVMVFTNSSTRSAALTAPVEGMLTWLEDTNRFEHYNGTTWVQTVVPSGLTFIKSQAIGTSVTSVAVADAFSDEFENYKIVAQPLSATTNLTISLQLGATATGYYSARNLTTYGSVNSVIGATNTSSWALGAIGTLGATLSLDIIGPFLTTRTGVIAGNTYHNATTSGYLTSSGGFLDNSLSYTGFTLGFGAGSVTGGTIYVYGYKKA